LDPNGVDPERLERAATVAVYRGVPTIARVDDTTAIGVLARPGEVARLEQSAGSTLAIDGRVDAVIRCRGELDVETSGVAVLQARLETGGPAVLNDFAAEFALAIASRPSGELVLARDAFGLHPLFVASRGRGVVFASDPAVLFALGIADDLDPGVVAAYLARNEPLDGRTAFRDVRAVLPGTWVRVRPDGARDSGDWFDPDLLGGPRLGHEEAVEAVREAVAAAVRSRVGGRRCGISLSGGRDSGSVAIAAAREGIGALGITQTFDPDLPVREDHLARALCDRHGLGWIAAPVPSCPSRAQLDDVPRWSGTPLTYFGFAQATAAVDAASEAGIEVVLTGEGGEPIFTSSDIAVLDLARTGHPLKAARAARRFHRVWGRSYGRLLKVAGRSIMPHGVLEARERVRPVPPWVEGKVTRALVAETAPRTDRRALLTALRNPHPAGYELDERLYQTRGVEPAYPLLDLRVVSVALSLTLVDRAPVERPKPILASAFLGELADDRVKMSFTPYYDRLAKRMQTAYPELFSAAGLAAQRGFIDPRGLTAIDSDDWRIDSLGVAVLELWLRQSI
jgi:asparagine synthetase B (glutamine-hydrolysing)